MIPDFQLLEVLEEDGKPVLYVVLKSYSLPVSQLGDGLHMLIRMVLEVAASRDGVILFEEPEAHLYPKAIWQIAKVMLACARRGVQVFLTTHSLELIDALANQATEADFHSMSLYRLLLERGGMLKHHRLAGSDIRFSRQQVEDDLR